MMEKVHSNDIRNGQRHDIKNFNGTISSKDKVQEAKPYSKTPDITFSRSMFNNKMIFIQKQLGDKCKIQDHKCRILENSLISLNARLADCFIPQIDYLIVPALEGPNKVEKSNAPLKVAVSAICSRSRKLGAKLKQSISITDRAQELGISIIRFEEAWNWLKRYYPKKMKDAIIENEIVEDPEKDKEMVVKQLTEPAIKIIDLRGKVRPEFARNCHFNKQYWPEIYSSCSELKEKRAIDNSSSKVTARTSNMHQKNSMKVKSKTKNVNKMDSQNAKSKLAVTAFCECCKLNYTNAYIHVQSVEHQVYATNEDNFRSIDRALDKEADLNSFFENVISSKKNKMRLTLERQKSLNLIKQKSANDFKTATAVKKVGRKITSKSEIVHVTCEENYSQSETFERIEFFHAKTKEDYLTFNASIVYCPFVSTSALIFYSSPPLYKATVGKTRIPNFNFLPPTAIKTKIILSHLPTIKVQLSLYSFPKCFSPVQNKKANISEGHLKFSFCKVSKPEIKFCTVQLNPLPVSRSRIIRKKPLKFYRKFTKACVINHCKVASISRQTPLPVPNKEDSSFVDDEDYITDKLLDKVSENNSSSVCLELPSEYYYNIMFDEEENYFDKNPASYSSKYNAFSPYLLRSVNQISSPLSSPQFDQDDKDFVIPSIIKNDFFDREPSPVVNHRHFTDSTVPYSTMYNKLNTEILYKNNNSNTSYSLDRFIEDYFKTTYGRQLPTTQMFSKDNCLNEVTNNPNVFNKNHLPIKRPDFSFSESESSPQPDKIKHRRKRLKTSKKSNKINRNSENYFVSTR